MKEEWKKVPDYGVLYEVSNFGRVRSYHTFMRDLKPKIVKASSYQTGHQYVTLCYRGKQTKHKVHRLVAAAFLPNPDNKPVVNHIDGNPANNRADNLEWATVSENTLHSIHVLGHNNSVAKRKRVQCLETKEVFESITQASSMTGINKSHIGEVAAHKSQHKTAGGFHWEYCKKV